MDVLAAWLLFPVALTLVCAGIGLLVGRAAGRTLPGALVLPTGFCSVLVLANLLTGLPALARLGLPVLLLIALLGMVLARARLARLQLDRWAAGTAVAVFVVFAAPAALSGTPTFSGSLALPDTANQLILAAQLKHDGRHYQQPPQSSFDVSVAKYLGSQYPVAGQAAVGVLSSLGLEDTMWLYQSFLSYAMAMAALALYGLLGATTLRASRRAAVAFVAAQPALLYSYALQGSIKEVVATSALLTTFALAADVITERVAARGTLPVAVGAAAAVGALGPAAVPYLAVPALALTVVWAFRFLRPGTWVREGAWGIVAVIAAGVLAAPVIKGGQTAYAVASAVLSMTQDLGNLAAPLKTWQALGVWMGGDFRYEQEYPTLGLILTVGVAIAAVFGVGWIIRRKAIGPLLAIGTLVPVSAYLLSRGSPYADGKVLMVASPALVLAAGLGVAWVDQAGRRFLAIAAGIVVGIGVVGSNALAYHAVQDAPYHRYAELLKIDHRFHGQGLALFSEYDEYAGYLLRDLRVQNEPESALGYRGRPARRPNGLIDRRHRPSVKSPLDIDDLTTAFVQRQNLLVLRRSPTTSHPPADFRRVFAGRYYDVWRREQATGTPRVVSHLPLGKNLFSPGAVPSCRAVRELGRRAQHLHARLAYVFRASLTLTNPLDGPLPNGWFQFGAYPHSVVPAGPGSFTRTVRLFGGGRYRVWLEGSFGRAVHVAVDGHAVGSVAYQPGNGGQYFPLAQVSLGPGLHRVTVSRGGGDLRPGDGGGSKSSLRHIGPVVLSPQSDEMQRVQTVSADHATELCGRRLDWVEIVARR